MRMRKKKNLGPRMEKCAPVHVRDGFALKGRWREELMPQAGRYGWSWAAARAGSPWRQPVGTRRCCSSPSKRSPTPWSSPWSGPWRRKSGMYSLWWGTRRCCRTTSPRRRRTSFYINFCDPWPPRGQAKRRLTHRGFLETLPEGAEAGGRIEFKTDNQPLFEFSLKEFPAAGYELSEVTRNLHENGPQGVMTDYEAKFYEQGLPINRCVGHHGGVGLARSLRNKVESHPGTFRSGVAFRPSQGPACRRPLFNCPAVPGPHFGSAPPIRPHSGECPLSQQIRRVCGPAPGSRGRRRGS